MIIDIHTHAFPDDLAGRAIAALEAETNGVKACAAATVASLIDSMDEAGIDRSAIMSIATKPKQFKPIFDWSLRIVSERIVPFASVHPDDLDAVAHVREIKQAGLHGIKLHPYYQQFDLTEKRMWPLYEAMQDERLVVLCHTGFDIAFPRDRICDPARISELTRTFPGLVFIASHLGGWEDWDEVERHILGRDVYIEVSLSHDYVGAERMKALLERHPADRLLFGSDFPWADQVTALKQIQSLALDPARETALLGGTAARLLGMIIS